MESIVYIKDNIYKKYIETKNKDDENTYLDVIDFVNTILEDYKNSSLLNIVHSLINEYFDIEYDIIDDLNYKNKEQKKINREDAFFKLKVWERDKNCIICDIYDCHKSSYQVAHIFDFSKCETEEEKYDVNNGILLCSNMHNYFDDLDLKFVVDDECNDNNLVKSSFCDTMCDHIFYEKYNGKKILFNKKNIEYIKKKNNIFK